MFDNFGVMGPKQPQVTAERDRICRILEDDFGLPCHEFSDGTGVSNFVGLEFSKGRLFKVKQKRMLRLRRAIQCVLSRTHASGELIRILIGHITWICLLRRESLSFLHASYAFSQKNLHTTSKIWTSVRRELSCIASILPLLAVDITSPWSCTVNASDASLFGLGGCH